MGTCCSAHLTTKIRDYAKNAQNGAVTVTVIENPKIEVHRIEIDKPIYGINPIETSLLKGGVVEVGKCDYCSAPAEFTCSYYPKQT